MTQKRLNRYQRPISQRIIVRGILILDTPICLGSGDADSPTDMALLRDSISDCALLTGASIAGALRNYVREYDRGYCTGEEKSDRATILFGGTRRDPDGEQSPLIIDDAISNKIPVVEFRDGVALESTTRTAKKGQKYDLELLASGTEFVLSFELAIEKNQSPAEQQTLISLLALALRGLERGEISIGMKKRRGFGRCQVKEWQVWNFNIEDTSDRTAWLTLDHSWLTDPPCTKSPAVDTSIVEAMKKAGLQVPEDWEDRRDRFTIKATFQLVGSLLIRSGQNSTERAPDVVHLKSHRHGELKSVLSGTSLAGVLRHRAERIVNTLQGNLAVVNELFGFVDGKEAKASRLVVNEKVIKDATDLVQNRIAIDRFTGGAYHGALFDEQPIFGGEKTRVCIELELRNPKTYEIGLLLLLLKDLWTSDLPVGGESSIGRGRLKGIQADLIWHRPQNAKNWQIKENQGNLQITELSDANYSENLVKDELEQFVKDLLKKLGKEV